MRCHYVYDKIYGKVRIPGCWGVILHEDMAFCTCYENIARAEESAKVKSLQKELKDSEKLNAKLWRIIKKMGGIDIATKLK